MTYDTAIIGTGPAGLSAAINLKLHHKSLIWFGAAQLSDKVERSEQIFNYPGVGLVTGEELNQKLDAHRRALGLAITDKRVIAVMRNKNGYILSAENEIYEAKTLLLATGVVPAKGFEGEQAFLGRGVSYCATCDGFLYKGKTIAVFCALPKYEHEVAFLSELAQKVYLFPAYQNCAVNLPHVKRLKKPIRRIIGEKRVRGLELMDGERISVDGLFILRNAIAPAALLPGLEMDGPHIVTNRAQATAYPGCYAAGDCTGRPYQIAKAVGEGNVAAHSILEYLGKQHA